MGAIAVTAVVVGIVIAATGGSGKRQASGRARLQLAHGGAGGSRPARSTGGVSGGAAGGSGAGEPRGDLAEASAYFGISKAKLRRELSSGRSLAAVAATTPGHSALGLLESIMHPRVRRIEAQVAAKRITEAEAQTRIARIRSRVQARLARSVSYEPTVAVAARYLGLSPTELRDSLRGGHTLSQLADKASGRSASGLIAAVMAVRVHELVHGAGNVSEDTLRHEKALLGALEQRVRREVQQPAPDG